MSKVLFALVKTDEYRIWVYGGTIEDARETFKMDFLPIGNFPLYFSKNKVKNIPSAWRKVKFVSIVKLLETFIEENFPPYQKEVLKSIHFAPKVMRGLIARRRRESGNGS